MPEVTEHLKMVEHVPVRETRRARSEGFPGTADPVLVFTIHDGGHLPRHLFGERTEEALDRPI